MSKKKKKQKPSSGPPKPAAERSLKQGKKQRQPVLKKRKQPNWPVTVLACVGMALTLYLTVNIWLGGTPLYCAEGSSCDIVQQSRWGTFLLLPTSFWGLLTYATLAFIGFKVHSPEKHWKAAWVVSAVGLGYSIYLTSMSVFVIDAVCAYCLISLSLMTITFGVIVSQRPEGMPKFKMNTWIAETVVVALIFVGGMHLHYSGVFDPAAGPEVPYLKGLATHLTENDAVLYGAFW